MLRKLLALLVLVTGLAALAQPAQARIFDVESVRTVDVGYACTVQAASRNDLAVATVLFAIWGVLAIAGCAQ